MIRQAIIDHHFAAYQTVLGIIGIAAAIHILLHFSLAQSIGYSAATVASFLLGQGIVALVQYKISGGRRSGNMLD